MRPKTGQIMSQPKNGPKNNVTAIGRVSELSRSCQNGPFSSSQLSENRTFFLNWCESVGKTSVKENRQPLTLRHKMYILANSISAILFSFYRGRKGELVKSLPFTSCLVPSVTFLHVFEGLV